MIRPRPVPPDFNGWNDLIGLIRESFAYMDGRIDPPSSARDLTPGILRERSRIEHLFLAGEEPLLGCAFFAPKPDALYIGKLAIAPHVQGRGLGRAFVKQAEELAKALSLPRLRLETRIELADNHAAFAALGFRRVSVKAHPGFTRPTSVMMEKHLSQSGAA